MKGIVSIAIKLPCKNYGYCDKCRSLGCCHSHSFVPVKDWLCYPKELEND